MVVPHDASTVVLLRGGDGRPGGLEIYLLRRSAAMAFAAGHCVFPGGAVDSRDDEAGIGWAGPSAQEWSDLLSTSAEHARGLVCAAVRETFEESGVLLAGPTPWRCPSAPPSAAARPRRPAIRRAGPATWSPRQRGGSGSRWK